MKKMKKFDVLVKMKIVIDCKKKPKYITFDELWVIYPIGFSIMEQRKWRSHVK